MLHSDLKSMSGSSCLGFICNPRQWWRWVNITGSTKVERVSKPGTHTSHFCCAKDETHATGQMFPLDSLEHHLPTRRQMMKTIRIFHSRYTYTSQDISRKKLEKSVRHSLRIADDEQKKMQWRDELSAQNLILFKDRIFPLNKLSEKQKENLFDELTAPPRLKNRQQHLKKRRSYKNKIKTVIKSEIAKGHKDTARLFELWLNIPDEKPIPENWLDQIDNVSLPMTRKQQRIDLLRKYATTHNLLCDAVKNTNSAYMQEWLFKIPHRWKITTDEVPADAYINIMKQFIVEYFPDYDVPCIVAHHDEYVGSDETGSHSHVFISAKNKKTGKEDLRKTQHYQAAKFQRQFGPVPDGELIPVDAALTYQQTVTVGSQLQQLFYSFVNKNLFAPIGIIAEFAPETERKSQQRRETNRQSRLAKGLRDYNLYNMQMERIKQNIIEETEKLEKLQSEEADIIPKLKQAQVVVENAELLIQQQNQQIEVLDAQIIEKKSTLDDLWQQEVELEHITEERQQKLDEVESKLNHAETQFKQITDQMHRLTEKVIVNAFMLFAAKTKGNQYMIDKLSEKLDTSAQQHFPPQFAPLLKGVLDMVHKLVPKETTTPHSGTENNKP